MDREKYQARLIDKKLDDYLKTFGAVCLEGPKWCGKTWTSSYHSKSEIYIASPEGNFQNRALAEMSPQMVLMGETPRLIDEWQEVPSLWDAVRFEVDKRNEKGQFILAGSSTPNHKGILHSGAGRIARLKMNTMSLYESKHSSGLVSLEALCHGKMEDVFTGEVSLFDLEEYILRGGWPGSLNLPLEQAIRIPEAYLKAIIEDDVYRIDGVKRNLSKMNLLLKSLARHESTTATNKTLKKDIQEKDNNDIDENTMKDYLDIFNRLFLTENQLPFSMSLRSSLRMKQAVKHHFCDPSLAASLLNAKKNSLIQDLETFGFLFEALCERDLKNYADTFDATLYHYQDYKGNEIDAVIQLSDGSWTAIEIKLGANQIDKAAENLLKVKKEIEKDPYGKPPSTLVVLCGLSNAAYKRKDGVYVLPLTALKN